LGPESRGKGRSSAYEYRTVQKKGKAEPYGNRQGDHGVVGNEKVLTPLVDIPRKMKRTLRGEQSISETKRHEEGENHESRPNHIQPNSKGTKKALLVGQPRASGKKDTTLILCRKNGGSQHKEKPSIGRCQTADGGTVRGEGGEAFYPIQTKTKKPYLVAKGGARKMVRTNKVGTAWGSAATDLKRLVDLYR